MSKRNKSSAPRRKKQGSLTYQIKHMELERKEKKDTPMLKKTENQYKKQGQLLFYRKKYSFVISPFTRSLNLAF